MDLARFQSLDIVLVCGLPASGKSHFSRTYFNQGGRKRINRKELRRLLYEMVNFGSQWREDFFNDHDELLVKHVERKIFEHLLQIKAPVLVDNTSVTIESRKYYLTAAQQQHKTVGAIFLNIPLKSCLLRNRARPAAEQISEGIITNLYASLELPAKAEGFREVLVLTEY